MTTTDERAAVLALTRATRDRPWFHTARVVLDAGGALALLRGGGTSRDAADRAHAAALAARIRPADLAWGRELIAAMLAAGVRLVTVLDDAYPGNLAWAYDRRPFLWFRGELRRADQRAVAVVGERDVAGAAEAARALAEAGLTVVAPLRTRLDAAVHEAALAAGGRTLAVLDGGIAEPSTTGAHGALAALIADMGAVISPFWPDAVPASRAVTRGPADIPGGPADPLRVLGDASDGPAAVPAVTCGLADSLYVADGDPDGVAAAHVARALATGKQVFTPARVPEWAAAMGARGGMTAVEDTDDLAKRAVTLVDVPPPAHNR
ncbi:DNA-processing protein DprA [Nonomuraea terrae]|uniref:DNA-processing protein DprA n=1 Tax=Nonomuraea terrae TaxID=2530383 RepID=UPI0037B21DBD